MIDRYGREWDLPRAELCPDCGQPDNCGDCSHEPLTTAEADGLGVKRLVKRLKSHLLPGACVLALALVPLGAQSCQESSHKLSTDSEKLERDSKELEKSQQAEERARGCEPTPPYHCPE